jgi:hypothetical protein
MIHINGKDYLFAKCTGFVCSFLIAEMKLDLTFYKVNLSGD